MKAGFTRLLKKTGFFKPFEKNFLTNNAKAKYGTNLLQDVCVDYYGRALVQGIRIVDLQENM